MREAVACESAAVFLLHIHLLHSKTKKKNNCMEKLDKKIDTLKLA